MAFTCTAPLNKKKVIFIMGATGTGKTKLSINLGTQFPSEIINSDKIQVYKGLNIVVNKISESERCGIPHHLLSIIDNDCTFTADDFCNHALAAIDLILENGHLPIIVGGSNNFLEALVEDPKNAFRSKYECCFIWLHVNLPVLFQYLDKRVDEMVDAGLVDEIREAFVPGANYSDHGIRKAIGVPEFDHYIQIEKETSHDEAYKEKVLQEAIMKTKENTRKLAEAQVMKIQRLKYELGWGMNMIDSTPVFEAVLRGDEYMHLFQEIVFKPSMDIVQRFLEEATQETAPPYQAQAACCV